MGLFSDFPHRLFLERPRTTLDVESSLVGSENTWNRIDLPEVVAESFSCFEEKDPAGEVLGRVWVRANVKLEEVEPQ